MFSAGLSRPVSLSQWLWPILDGRQERYAEWNKTKYIYIHLYVSNTINKVVGGEKGLLREPLLFACYCFSVFGMCSDIESMVRKRMEKSQGSSLLNVSSLNLVL